MAGIQCFLQPPPEIIFRTQVASKRIRSLVIGLHNSVSYVFVIIVAFLTAVIGYCSEERKPTVTTKTDCRRVSITGGTDLMVFQVLLIVFSSLVFPSPQCDLVQI